MEYKVFNNKEDFFNYQYFSKEPKDSLHISHAILNFPIFGISDILPEEYYKEVELATERISELKNCEKQKYFNVRANIVFSHVQFKDLFIIQNCIFGDLRFEFCEFNESVSSGAKMKLIDFFTIYNSSCTMLSFDNCLFYEDVKLKFCNFTSRLRLSQNVFKKSILTYNLKLKFLYFIVNTVGNGFKSYHSHFFIDHAPLITPLAIKNKIDNADHGGVIIGNNRFNGNVGLYKCIFKNTIECYENNFKRNLILGSGIFEKGIKFYSDRISSTLEIGAKEEFVFNSFILFNKIIAEAGSCIRLTNIRHRGKIKFNDSYINGLLYFNNIKVDQLEMFSTTISGDIDECKSNLDQHCIKDINTARLLKNGALKLNNKVRALEYHSIEMECLRKQLKWHRNFINKLIVSLNKITNNNGVNPLRAVVATVLFAIIFFTLTQMAQGDFRWGPDWGNCMLFDDQYWQGVMGFLWLPNTETFKDLGVNNAPALSYITYILGKVFIGYGIYQTISAFRKFGNK